MLSENELIIMRLLWKEKRPLTRSEILKGTPGKTWNPASIHLILNSMISKGVVKITDESVKYGRTYEAIPDETKYAEEVVRQAFPGWGAADVMKAMAEAFRKELKKDEAEEIAKILAKGKKK